MIDDGRRWLTRNPDRKFDAIVMNTSFHWREFASALLGREFLELMRNHLKPGGLAMWNCTGSSRAVATGLAVFPHSLTISNICIASDSPLPVDPARWRSILAAYVIDGRPVFDLATAAGRSEMTRLLAVANPGNPTHLLMNRREMEAVYGTARIITDDNLGEEYTFSLRENLFFGRLFK